MVADVVPRTDAYGFSGFMPCVRDEAGRMVKYAPVVLDRDRAMLAAQLMLAGNPDPKIKVARFRDDVSKPVVGWVVK